MKKSIIPWGQSKNDGMLEKALIFLGGAVAGSVIMSELKDRKHEQQLYRILRALEEVK